MSYNDFSVANSALRFCSDLPITIEKDKDDIYTVGCAALGFYTYGKSAEEGIGNLDKAVKMCRAVELRASNV